MSCLVVCCICPVSSVALNGSYGNNQARNLLDSPLRLMTCLRQGDNELPLAWKRSPSKISIMVAMPKYSLLRHTKIVQNHTKIVVDPRSTDGWKVRCARACVRPSKVTSDSGKKLLSPMFKLRNLEDNCSHAHTAMHNTQMHGTLQNRAQWCNFSYLCKWTSVRTGIRVMRKKTPSFRLHRDVTSRKKLDRSTFKSIAI